ncbi:MAG: ComEA family DNA-binding protein, partial [Candidatus Competibacteraceae bacterium]
MKLSNLLLAFILACFSIMAFAQAIDINTADVEQLQQIKGIGPKRAADIIQYREAHGPFGSVEDLTKVPGIGPKTLADNRDLLTVGGAVMPETPATPE